MDGVDNIFYRKIGIDSNISGEYNINEVPCEPESDEFREMEENEYRDEVKRFIRRVFRENGY